MEAWREELYHHGIKGQKWGIQNGPSYPLSREQRSPEEKKKSGAISDSGKDRYGKDGVSSNESSKSHEGVKTVSSDKMADTTKASLVKNASDMTNDELRNAINRMNNENQLKQMIAEQRVSKPADTRMVKEATGLAKNATSLVSAGAKLVGQKEFGESMGEISKLIGNAQNSMDRFSNIAQKNYQKNITNVKNNIDLSKMSDAELRSTIDRMALERTYNSLVARDDYINSGRARVMETLETANAVLGLGSSAVGVAATIKGMGTKSSKNNNQSQENTSKKKNKG